MNTNTKEIEDRVTREALDLYFQANHKNVLTAVLVPLAVIAVLWSQIDHSLLIGWALLMIAGIVAKHSLAASYLRQEVLYTDASKWGWRAGYITFYLGMLWAAAMFAFFVDDSVAHKIFLITVILSLGTYSLLGGIYWFPLHYLYAVPIIGALIIRLAMEGGLPYIALSVLMLFGLLLISSVARKFHTILHSEMRLRHESAELSKALQLKSEEAEKATLAKSRFLAAASHDLRQPLHSLALFIDLLKGSSRDEERAELFPRIDLSLGALSKLFDALLDISRLDANAVKPEFSHFHLADLVVPLADEFAQAASDKKISLRVWGYCNAIVSDRMLLERILRNLISNAIRYTEQGGVLITCRSRDDSILLQVWDTGIGIPQSDQESIFDEYYQLHNVQRDRNQGLGLGLSIVRRLCLLLNHPLELRSRPGRGSVFSLRIQKGSTGMVRSDEAAPTMHSWDLSGRFVVLIDDEREIRDAMDKLLTKWGCDVVVADSLEDAIDQLNRAKASPDIILSDLRLQDSNSGIEAINSLRELFGDTIPGILITGDTAPEQIVMANNSGYELLQKPVQPVRLRSVIQHHLSDRR